MSMVVGDEVAEKITDDGLEMIRTRVNEHFSSLSITEGASKGIENGSATIYSDDENRVLDPVIRRKKGVGNKRLKSSLEKSSSRRKKKGVARESTYEAPPQSQSSSTSFQVKH
jgi:hypothetical protein